MSVLLPPQPAEVYVRRRAALGGAFAGPVILFAGDLVPRNYAANVYPFRAHSHFLYFTGLQWPGAVLLGQGGAWEIFAAPPASDDPLWIGPSATWDDLQAASGVQRIRPLAELRTALDQFVAGRTPAATLPAVAPRTRARQASLLGRPWGAHDESEAGVVPLTGRDAELADTIISLRLQHDAPALELMRRAADATRAGHLAGMAATRPGHRESDVRAAIEHAFTAHGMSPAYGSIVTVHGEVLHNEHSHHLLNPGDLVLADCGAECHGWASDVTRTWPVSGAWSPTQRALYDIVLQANRDAIALVEPGTRYRDIHLKACLTLARGLVDLGILRGDPGGLVERGAHALFFPHGVGHLLGLDVHDMEDLGDRAGYAPGRTRSPQFGTCYLRLDRDLAPGTTVTIEPGIYLVPAILGDKALCGPFAADLDRDRLATFADVRGIRIEDDVLCTEAGPEVITAAIPKDPSEIEGLVGRA